MASATSADSVRLIAKAREALRSNGLAAVSVLVTVSDEGDAVDVFPPQSEVQEVEVESVDDDIPF